MRKFLLASAATVGLVGVAAAQTVTLPSGVTSTPVSPPPYLGGNNALNSSGAALPAGPTTPTPGSMVIHLNGRVWFYAEVTGSSGDNVGGNKVSPFGFTGYARLYPGMDAMAANGLRYGGIMEIRQNFAPAVASAGASGASAASFGSTLYFRREALYVGSNTIGIFRFGQDDGPISQFENGVTTLQTFGSGGWNGDGPNLQLGNTQPTWPFWSGIGNEYTISKAVYLSPQIAGFDFGLSFAPNNDVNTGTAFCAVAGTGCQALSTSTVAADSYRAKNMFEIMARYQGSFNGVGVYAEGGYVGSGHVNTIAAGGNLANGFSVGDGGLALTYAGFTVGGHVIAGDFNGQVALQPVGGVHAVAWIGGVQYATGPLTLGASWYNYQSQGAAGMVGKSQRYENGLAVGGTYAIAPGLIGTAEYLYGQRYQGGMNFLTGTTGSTLNNNVHTQGFLVGTRVQW